MRAKLTILAIFSLLMAGIVSSSYGYPAAGTDAFLTRFEMEILPAGATTGEGTPVILGGSMLVRRDDPGDKDEDGLKDVQTEIISLQLAGDTDFGHISVRAGRVFDLPSPGQVEQMDFDQDFPADSFFDVTYQIDLITPDGTLMKGEPAKARMVAVITKLPPLGNPYKKVDPLTFVLIGPNKEVLRLVSVKTIHRPLDDPPVPEKRSVKKLTIAWGKLKTDR